MRRFYFALIGASLVAACGQKKPEQVAVVDSASRDIKLSVPDSTVPLNDAPSSPTANKVDTVYLPQATPPKVVTPEAESRRRRPIGPRAVNASFDTAESAPGRGTRSAAAVPRSSAA